MRLLGHYNSDVVMHSAGKHPICQLSEYIKVSCTHDTGRSRFYRTVSYEKGHANNGSVRQGTFYNTYPGPGHSRVRSSSHPHGNTHHFHSKPWNKL